MSKEINTEKVNIIITLLGALGFLVLTLPLSAIAMAKFVAWGNHLRETSAFWLWFSGIVG